MNVCKGAAWYNTIKYKWESPINMWSYTLKLCLIKWLSNKQNKRNKQEKRLSNESCTYIYNYCLFEHSQFKRMYDASRLFILFKQKPPLSLSLNEFKFTLKITFFLFCVSCCISNCSTRSKKSEKCILFSSQIYESQA